MPYCPKVNNTYSQRRFCESELATKTSEWERSVSHGRFGVLDSLRVIWFIVEGICFMSSSGKIRVASTTSASTLLRNLNY